MPLEDQERWTIEFPMEVYHLNSDGTLEQVVSAMAPLSVRNAIAEATWGIAHALLRTTNGISIVATVDDLKEDLSDGKPPRRR